MSSTVEVAPRPPRRILAALLQGILLATLLLVFRISKARILDLDAGLLDWVTLLLPELGAVAVLECLAVALARWLRGPEGRLSGASILWWIGFVLVHLGAYTLAILEHTFFLHTGIRLDLELMLYAAGHFQMLQGLLAYGVDGSFLLRASFAGGLLLVGLILAWALPLSGELRRRLAPQRQTLLASTLGALILVAVPATAVIAYSGLGTTTLGGFFRSKPSFTEEMQRAAAEMVPPDEYYREPRLTAPPTRTPNVVLLILESTRADVTPPYAPRERWSRTPHLAALAEESVVVDTAYSSVTHTSKALVAILCGMYPRLAMPIYEHLEDNLPLQCMPHLLAQGGYRTAFLQTAMGRFENRPGLVRNFGFQQAAFQETLRRPGFGTTGYLGLDEMAMVEPALQWIQGGGPEPFFLTLLTLSTHHPYQVPGQPVVTAVREHRKLYDDAIEHQDQVVGALVDGLRASGRLEDTVLIVLGDHGEAFGEHRRWQHDIVPYEEVVRVPWLIRAPWLLEEKDRVEGLRHHVDLLPTVLGLLQAPWEGELPGQDLFDDPGHPRVFSSCWFTNTCLAMREGDRKWIFHYGLRPTEAFDLASDPGETENLALEMSEEEIHRAEERILGFRLTVDAWWAEHPAQTSGAERWWQEAPPPAGPNAGSSGAAPPGAAPPSPPIYRPPPVGGGSDSEDGAAPPADTSTP
ncbi:MAG: sulfatase [Acidobacteriota bacterium]|nr:sulfatase [Acidobacteriota bacterium]